MHETHPLRRPHRAILALVVLSAIGATACSGDAGAGRVPSDNPEFAGTFRGGELTVELRREGQDFAGSILRADQRFPATAFRDGRGIRGRFRSGEEDFDFRAELRGDDLEFWTGDTRYELRRLAAQNPLARPGTVAATPVAKAGAAATPAAVPAALATAVRFTEVYRHPVGVHFLHPAGWTVRAEGDALLSIVPDDLHRIAGEPAEVFLVTGEAAPGIERATDQRVLTLARQAVEGTFTNLRSDGEPQPLGPGGAEGVELRWRGESEGIGFRASMRVRLLSGYAIGVFALVPDDRFAARHAVLGELFKTLSYEKPATDPRLHGTWKYRDTYVSGSFSAVTVRHLVLRADGSCETGSRLSAGMEHADSTGAHSGSSSARSGGGNRQGRFRTEGRQIVLQWDDGNTARWDLILQGDDMLWKSGKERQLWSRTSGR